MRELDPQRLVVRTQPSARLSDEEILEMFRRVVKTPGLSAFPRMENRWGGGPAESATEALAPSFLYAYACALICAPRRDFLILRPASLVLIAKYGLQPAAEAAPVVHNFPGGGGEAA
jgi:hypothetical protein